MTTIRRDGESEMDFEARQDADRKREAQAASQANSRKITQAEATKAKTAEPEKELTPQERLEALLVHARAQARHGAPISPFMLTELDAITAAGRDGKTVAPHHDFPGDRIHEKRQIIAGVGDKVTVINSAEDALDFIRALPTEVRDRPHWVLAERTVLNAVDTNDPKTLNEAAIMVETALSNDRNHFLADRKADERLPDGRLREDRFPDRRPPVAPEPQPAA